MEKFENNDILKYRNCIYLIKSLVQYGDSSNNKFQVNFYFRITFKDGSKLYENSFENHYEHALKYYKKANSEQVKFLLDEIKRKFPLFDYKERDSSKKNKNTGTFIVEPSIEDNDMKFLNNKDHFTYKKTINQRGSANMKKIDFSPQIWWSAMDRGVELTGHLAKDLIKDFNFKDWLRRGAIEHNSLEIHKVSQLDDVLGHQYEYLQYNEYYNRVFYNTNFDKKIYGNTIDDLQRNVIDNKKIEIKYEFRIDNLNHLITFHFNNWLNFDTYEDWFRWRLYYYFLINKLDIQLKGIYNYYWSTILGQLNLYTNFFKSIEQYKKFRDEYEEINKNSEIFFLEYQEKIKEKN
ncbi:hypothetical protein D3C71_34420 [compost metagenome]